MKLTKFFFAIATLTGITAYGQIFVVNFQTGRIGKYNTVGTPLNTNLITGLAGASAVAMDANWLLYVADAGRGKVGVYTTSGTPVNTNLITGLSQPLAVALDGSGYLYVLSYNNGTVAKYSTNGTLVNASLIYNLTYPSGLAIDGQGNIYVGDHGIKVGKYTTSGTAVNTSLITGVSPEGGSLAVDGNGNLYVANYYAGTIGKYTTSGTTLNASLVTGLKYPNALALDQNGHLFVGNNGTNNNAYFAGRGTVGEYTTSGATVNAAVITGLTEPRALVAVSMAVPTPTASLVKAVKPSFSNLFLGIDYQLQVSRDMQTWTNQGSAFSATNTSMVYPQYWDVDNWGKLFFRLQVAP